MSGTAALSLIAMAMLAAIQDAPGHPSVATTEPAPLRITFAVSASLLRVDSLSADLTIALRRADERLRPFLGRPLQIARVIPWPEALDCVPADVLLMRLLSTIPRGDAEIVVGLSHCSADWAANVRGAGSYEEGYIGQVVNGPLRDIDPILAHELAHLFGAVHSKSPSDLMHEFVMGSRIDPINSSLIALHRKRRFETISFPLAQEDLENARTLYRDALALGPPASAEAELKLARIAIERESHQEAIDSLQPLVSRDRANLEAAGLLATAYRRVGRYDEAVQLNDRILRAGPNARVEYNRAIALSRQGKTAAAIAGYERALELAPHFQPAMANLGRAYAEKGRTTEAITLLRKALQIEPDDEVALDNLAFALVAAGDLNAARMVVKKLLEREPDSASAYNTLGKIHEAGCRLQGSGPCAGAIDAFQRAAGLDPGYAEPLVNLAQLHLEAGDLQAAGLFARRALQLRPWWAAARVISGRTMLAAERWEEAAAELARAIQHDPESATSYGELGYAYLMLGESSRAAIALRKALDLDNRLAPAWMNLGIIFSRQGDSARAIECYERALEVNPAYADAYLNLGHAQLARQQLRAAAEAYERALALGPPKAVAHNNLAVIVFRLGSIDRAWEHALEARRLGWQPHPGFIAELERASGQRWPRD